MFITFEGPDGSGKSTQVPLLVRHLEALGLPVIAVREPGGTPIGDQIRQVVHDLKNEVMDPHTELLLYSASRAQLVAQVIRPHLQGGDIVICDRYADSTLAYQGYGRGLDLAALRQITYFATSGLTPDLTLYLDIDAEAGLARRSAEGEWNRMDAPPLDFHRRVRAGYLDLLAVQPERWVRIDASQPIAAVQAAISAVVDVRLQHRANRPAVSDH